MVKVVSLVSGGVDSAVATALAMQQGMEVVFLHFDTRPLGNTKGEEKTIALAKHLSKKFGTKLKVCVVPHSPALFEIAKKCNRKYSCVLCRRVMLRIASEFARKEGANAIVTGESLGQVASQTLFNLNAEHSASEIPVLKPFLGMDKLEIERLAKEFGTFETSTLPSACCSIPAKPATKATEEKIEIEEQRIDVKKLLEESLSGKRCKTIGLNDRK